MSKVIQFLERVGQDSELRSAGNDAARTAAEAAGVTAELSEALQVRDHSRLSLLLGVRSNIVCAVFPAKQDEDEQEDKPDEEEKDSPDEKGATNVRTGRIRVANGS